MNTTLHTFMDIFTADFAIDEDTSVQLQKIVIPIIQRDYAQGRTDADVQRVRKRFLNSLHKAITESAITLDFVYGDIDKDGVMTPLDGQQRLTTLFLLHYYAAKKEGIAKEEYAFLHNFSYETRYSARDFCDYLVEHHEPSFTLTLSEEIKDQAWFPLEWKKDPTISSMLVMLDAIAEVFKDTENIWNRLKDGAISFYFLPIKDMGLTDELYIKMNSRGKPLTQFEHFKAELEHGLREVDENVSKRIMRKIDIDWTDMLWQYRGEDNVIDDEFLRYFRFVCDIICYQSGGTTQGKQADEFDLQKEYFSKTAPNVEKNIQQLESYFDCWCNLSGETPSEFIKRFNSYRHEIGKIKIEQRYDIDIFKNCLESYSDVSGNGNRSFPLNRIILLFAIVTYLQNRTTVTEDEFARRLRIVNNLTLNSEDEISDSEHRTSGNRMPAILKQVEILILTGVVDLSIDKSLNTFQLQEEAEKLDWVVANPQHADALFELEDHELLQGQIAIVGLEHPEYFSRFTDLFKCKRDLIDCAMMSCGMYAQQEKGWRHQLGCKATNAKPWRTLFHKSSNKGFDITKNVLAQVLDTSSPITDVYLSTLANDYVASCESTSVFDIRYYYIKYALFRPGYYGKYTWEDLQNKPYDMAVMLTETKWSENTYQPFLKAVDDKRISREHCGQRIIFDDRYLKCENDAYVVRLTSNDAEIYRLSIPQNEFGIDIEDRILKIQAIYADILSQLVAAVPVTSDDSSEVEHE